MTLKHYNECDRCGATYTAKDPKEVIFVRLPNKIIPAAKPKGTKPSNMIDSSLIMIPIPMNGLNPDDIINSMNPPPPEHAYVEFCPDCEISLIAWFDSVFWDTKRKEWS